MDVRKGRKSHVLSRVAKNISFRRGPAIPIETARRQEISDIEEVRSMSISEKKREKDTREKKKE